MNETPGSATMAGRLVRELAQLSPDGTHELCKLSPSSLMLLGELARAWISSATYDARLGLESAEKRIKDLEIRLTAEKRDSLSSFINGRAVATRQHLESIDRHIKECQEALSGSVLPKLKKRQRELAQRSLEDQVSVLQQLRAQVEPKVEAKP